MNHTTTTERDTSKTALAVWVPIIIAIAGTLGALGGWVYDKVDQREKLNDKLLNELSQIELQLNEAQSIHDLIYAKYVVPHLGILESYVKKRMIKVRRAMKCSHIWPSLWLKTPKSSAFLNNMGRA